jgi:hypothetical protein
MDARMGFRGADAEEEVGGAVVAFAGGDGHGRMHGRRSAGVTRKMEGG